MPFYVVPLVIVGEAIVEADGLREAHQAARRDLAGTYIAMGAIEEGDCLIDTPFKIYGPTGVNNVRRKK